MLVRTALALMLLASPVIAGEAPYVTAKDIDLRVFLPRPVANDSDAAKEQSAEVLAVQKAAPPERAALAAADDEESVFDMYARTFGPAFKAEALPKASHLFARVGESEDASVDPAKPFFGRIRPYLANPEIKSLGRPSKSGSYPSGHTTRVTAVAAVLTMMLPEKHDEIWRRAGEYAESRVVAGLHYRSDLEAGFRAGSALGAAIMSNAEFKADYAGARDEIRRALGLPN